MAEDRLIRAAAGAILLAGAVAEAAAPSATALLTAGDYAAGASLALAGATLGNARSRSALLALATAALWFAATPSGAGGPLGDVAAALLVVHRGPLLHLLLGPCSRRRERLLVGSFYVAAALPVDIAGPATSVVALAAAAAVLLQARSATADRRGRLLVAGGIAVAFSLVWLLASADAASPTALALADDGLLIASAGLAVARLATGVRGAVGALVVELGPQSPGSAPVGARLSRVLADPDLQVRFRVPDLGWVDEAGHMVAAPNGDAVTRAPALDGGEAALVHGPAAIREPELANAVARAAALAMDTARLTAEARRQAEAVRASRTRLLTAADAERHALEDRLARGPMRRLDRVDEVLASLPGPDVAGIRAELIASRRDLEALATGLFPAAVARGDLAEALRASAARSPVPVGVEITGDISELPTTHRAAIYFVVSEALANVAKYARAEHAQVSVDISPQAAVIRVSDDGIGGAALTARGGLAGLADRVEALGGRFDVHSPTGECTVVTARLPRALL